MTPEAESLLRMMMTEREWSYMGTKDGVYRSDLLDEIEADGWLWRFDPPARIYLTSEKLWREKPAGEVLLYRVDGGEKQLRLCELDQCFHAIARDKMKGVNTVDISIQIERKAFKGQSYDE